MHLQHAPGTVRPLPSWNRAVVLATPEGTRTTASGHVRPQDTAAYMDQAVRRTAMWLPTARGTCTPRARRHPTPRPRTVRPHLTVSPGRGTCRTQHGLGQSLCPVESLGPRTASTSTRIRTPGQLTTPSRDDSDEGPRKTRIGAGRACKRPAARTHSANTQ